MTSKNWVRAITAAVAIGLFPASVMGQGTSGGTSGTTGGTTWGNTTSTSAPTSSSAATNTPRPIFLAGRVMMEDGAAPPGLATVETVCSGSPHSEGYTDSRGYFSVQLGARNGLIRDAGEDSPARNWTAAGGTGGSNPIGPPGRPQTSERKYRSCDLQAKLAGYRSQTVPLAGRLSTDDPNIGTILLHRNGPAEEGKTVSMVSLAAPKDARKAYEKGLDSVRKNKLDDAQSDFERAVGSYPDYAAAWYELGMLQAGQGKMDMARKYFEKASTFDSKYLPPYLQVSILDLQASRWKELADVTEKVVALNPFDYPQAFYFNSVANYNLHNLDAAEKSALAAERLDTRHAIPELSHLLGLILAYKKDYAGAAERFKAYLKLAPEAKDAAKVRSQLAEVEKITAAMAAR